MASFVPLCEVFFPPCPPWLVVKISILKTLEFSLNLRYTNSMKDTNTSVKYSCWKTIFFIFAAAVLLLAFSGCFSPWEGEGTLTIDLGGGDLSRVAVNSGEIANFEYEIILEGPGGKIKKTIKGGGTITLELAPGIWDLMLRAIGDRPDDDGMDYFPSLYFPPRMLRALGYNNAVDVKAGKNTNVTLQMTAATEISNEDQFIMANTGLSDKPEILVIKESMEFEADFMWYGKVLTLITDNTDREITLTFTSSSNIIFGLTNGGTPPYQGSALTLGRPGMKGSLIIDGGGKEHPRPGPIVNVDFDCTLIMYDGVTLRNSFNNDPNGPHPGGGVYVGNGGTFIMHGGEISGNWAQPDSGNMNGGLGGGVYVDGTFEMHGNSKVAGNYAIAGATNNGNGGGVFVEYNAMFIMSGGEISGNTADGSNSSGSIEGHGGGVYISGGKHFEKTGGVIYGNDGGEKSNYVTNRGEAVYCFDSTPAVGSRYRSRNVWDNISYIGGNYSGTWEE